MNVLISGTIHPIKCVNLADCCSGHVAETIYVGCVCQAV